MQYEGEEARVEEAVWRCIATAKRLGCLVRSSLRACESLTSQTVMLTTRRHVAVWKWHMGQ